MASLLLSIGCGSKPDEGPGGTWSYAWSAEKTSPADFLKRSDIDWQPIENVWNPPGREPRAALYARYELNDHDFTAPDVFFDGFDQVVEIYRQRPAGLEKIYSFGDIRADGTVIFSGNPFHLISLEASDRVLFFRIHSDHTNIGVQGQPKLGRGVNLIEQLVAQESGQLLMGAWTMLAAVLGVVLFLRTRKEQLFIAFALVCLLSGLYVITRTDSKQLLLYSPYWWVITEFTSLYLLPAAVHYYFLLMLGPGTWNYRKFLIPIQLVYTLIAIPASVAGFVPLVKTLPPAQILLLLALVLTFGSTIRAALDGNAEAKVVAVGWLVATLTAVHGILVTVGVLPWSPFFIHYGILGFLASLAIVLARRVALQGENLERTSKYLSRVIREQNMTVAFRTEALQRSRDEIEKISEVARDINSSTDLDIILNQIFAYFYTEFGVEAVILQLLDKEKNELYTIKTTAPPNAASSMVDFSRDLKVPLDESSGILYKTFLRKRPFYLAKIDDRAFPDGATRRIVDELQLKSFALLPLVISGDAIGMILLTSYDRKLSLSREQIKRIDRFGEQIAGAINHANLLRRAENARREAQAERRKADEIRYEIEALNKFSREVSSNPHIDEILDKIFFYVIEQFNLMGCYLYLIDEKTDELYHYKSMMPDSLDSERLSEVRNRRISLESESILAAVCRRKKALYLPRLRERGGTEGDHDGIVGLGLSSIYMVPLLVQDQVRGLMAFSNFDSPMYLRKQDLASIERFCQQISGAVSTASLLRQVDAERKTSNRLLLNVLPSSIAGELKEKGKVEPQTYEAATVLFTDIKNFTSVVANLKPHDLLVELDKIFEQFDWICEKNKMEKLKTIGDAYMGAGGLPDANNTHAIDACLTAMEIQSFMSQTREIKQQLSGEDFWELRIGLHTGPVVAGVVGKNKFSYDIWGDAVNVAARMETSGEAGRVNISRNTYDLVKYFFECEYRGQIQAKNRGMLDMYFLNRIRPELSRDPEGRVPNEKFKELYERVAAGARLRYRSEADDA